MMVYCRDSTWLTNGLRHGGDSHWHVLRLVQEAGSPPFEQRGGNAKSMISEMEACHVLPLFELCRRHEAVFSEPLQSFEDTLCPLLDGMGLFLSAHSLQGQGLFEVLDH